MSNDKPKTYQLTNLSGHLYMRVEKDTYKGEVNLFLGPETLDGNLSDYIDADGDVLGDVFKHLDISLFEAENLHEINIPDGMEEASNDDIASYLAALLYPRLPDGMEIHINNT